MDSETPLACELILFVFLFRMSHRMPQLVLRDTLASLSTAFLSWKWPCFKGCSILCERLYKNEKTKSWKSLPVALPLPIKQHGFPTASHILMSRNRVLDSVLVQWRAWVILPLHISDHSSLSWWWSDDSVGKVAALQIWSSQFHSLEPRLKKNFFFLIQTEHICDPCTGEAETVRTLGVH